MASMRSLPSLEVDARMTANADSSARGEAAAGHTPPLTHCDGREGTSCSSHDRSSCRSRCRAWPYTAARTASTSSGRGGSSSLASTSSSTHTRSHHTARALAPFLSAAAASSPAATAAAAAAVAGQRAYRGALKRVEHPLPPELEAAIAAAHEKPARPAAPPLEARQPTPMSRRSGLVAVKAGMTQEWDEHGVRVPLTVLWVDDCQVVRHKHVERDGTTALVLGAGSCRPKQLGGSVRGQYEAAGVVLKRRMWEVPVTEDALLPAGTELRASHFVAGQELDVTGVTKGKGFQGVIKRWGFAGQPASHGNTKHHRAPGSIGGRTDPGKVWKGKKMPGRMGGDQRTVKNVWLYKVDPERNLLYVRGQVPGPQGSFVLVRDAFRWPWPQRLAAGLPFPTALGGEQAAAVAVAPRPGQDPYQRYREEVDFFETNWKGD